VSRGLGILQRRVCEALEGTEDQELPLRELRRRLGDPDRSNVRRAIRGLLAREMVKEIFREGERCVELTFWGYTVAGARSRELPRPGHALRVWRGESAGDVHWFGHVHAPLRDRPPGGTQLAVLAALREDAGPQEEGLPVADVKAIVGGDPANTRRAIRLLLKRSLLEESADGRRVRLSPQGVLSAPLRS
jgi:hypothetical protein